MTIELGMDVPQITTQIPPIAPESLKSCLAQGSRQLLLEGRIGLDCAKDIG